MDNIVTFPPSAKKPVNLSIRTMTKSSLMDALALVKKTNPAAANNNALGDMGGDVASVLRKDARHYISEVHRDIILAHPTPLHPNSKWEFVNFAWALTTEVRDCMMGRGREFEQSYLAFDNACEALANTITAIKELRGCDAT